MEDTYEIINHGTNPDYRACVVRDLDPHEPDGDALAPCFTVYASADGRFANSVYVPTNAEDIRRAYQHYCKREWDRDKADREVLFERYLRLVAGATDVRVVEDGVARHWIFDTPDYREHVGMPNDGTASVEGEAKEWRAYIEGDVYGIVIERRRTGVTNWSDGSVDAIEEWIEEESTWGFYGAEYAIEAAKEELAACGA